MIPTRGVTAFRKGATLMQFECKKLSKSKELKAYKLNACNYQQIRAKLHVILGNRRTKSIFKRK